MTKTLKPARQSNSNRTGSEVQTMLHDIATVLRLTAMVKAEMIRDRVEADRKMLDGRRSMRGEEAAVSA